MALIVPVGTVGAQLETGNTSLTIDFEKVTVMKMTSVLVFVGDSTDMLRLGIDADTDGTVTAAEVQAYQTSSEAIMETPENFTLDGKKATTINGDFTVDGAVGPTDSTDDLTWTVVTTSTFPEPDDKNTHTYAWPAAEDLLGEDETWTSDVVTLKVMAPNGWKFDTDAWSEDTKAFLKSGDTAIDMNTAQIIASYNDTVGNLNSFVIKKEDGGDDGEDDTPGFGLIVALAAVGVATLVTRRRR